MYPNVNQASQVIQTPPVKQELEKIMQIIPRLREGIGGIEARLQDVLSQSPNVEMRNEPSAPTPHSGMTIQLHVILTELEFCVNQLESLRSRLEL